jgi:hypothetical protein
MGDYPNVLVGVESTEVRALNNETPARCEDRAKWRSSELLARWKRM